jgi:hypothetical protein
MRRGRREEESEKGTEGVKDECRRNEGKGEKEKSKKVEDPRR